MAELSIVLDIPLMHTLAQASAAFISILAGFYTAKVLSIASDKNRLAAKIKEIQNEVKWRRNISTTINARINAIGNKWDEEYIELFRDYIVDKPFESIPTSDELMQELKQYAKENFTENLQRILEIQTPSIIAEIKKHREEKFSGTHYVSYHKSEAEMQNRSDVCQRRN